MFLAQIMKHPLFSTLQNGVKGFSRIVMDIATRILLVAVVNPIMSGKLFADELISTAFISDQIRIFINKALYLRAKLTYVVTGHWYGPGPLSSTATNTHCLLVPLPRLYLTPW